MTKPKIAIIGAGASALMCADVLKEYQVSVCVFEQLPSAGRKLLWAGKTGLNISHAEPIEVFVSRYTPSNPLLTKLIKQFDSVSLQNFAKNLGIDTFIGSTGRIFPVQMKASGLLRAWLKNLQEKGVKFFYNHKCVHIDGNHLIFEYKQGDKIDTLHKSFDAIVLACGGLSYPKLGSTGDWQSWVGLNKINPMYASNVGITKTWSQFLTPFFGQALKGVQVWLDKNDKHKGDIIISHYGFESGTIYKLNQQMRQKFQDTHVITVYLDLLPDVDIGKIKAVLTKNPKSSLSTRLAKAGLDKPKIALLRETTNKADWQDNDKIAFFIKNLKIQFDGFRPISEAISTGGGLKFSAMDGFCLKSNPAVFCTGEMLDFDAPTGGYLLTACFALGRGCGFDVIKKLDLKKRI